MIDDEDGSGTKAADEAHALDEDDLDDIDDEHTNGESLAVERVRALETFSLRHALPALCLLLLKQHLQFLYNISETYVDISHS